MTALVNIEAEQALLGALLVNNDVMPRVGGIVRPEDFADQVHGAIYAEIDRKIGIGELASPITLRMAFEGDAALATLGGPAYLVRLAGAAISLFAAKDYAALVADCAKRRRLAAVLEEARAALEDPERDAASVMGSIEATQLVEDQRGTAQIIPFARALTDAAMAAHNARTGEGEQPMPSGVAALDQMLGGFYPGDLVILAGRPGMGKAQPLDAPVLMEDGAWREIGKLRFGDRLASVDGAPSLVVATYDRGRLPSFRVRFSDGRETIVAADHLWRVTSRHWPAPRVLSTDEVSGLLRSKRHRGRLSIDLISGEFGGGAMPVDAYILGAIIGDGCTRNALSITSADDEVLENISGLLPETMELRAIGNSSFGYGIRNKVRGGANPVIDALRGLGVMGVLGEDKRVPPMYLRASRAVRLALLQGLMDTDGWAETLGAVRFCTTSPGLAEDVVSLVRSLGGLASIRVKAPVCTKPGGEKVSGRQAYIVKIRHHAQETLFRLSRKSSRCKRGWNSSVRLNIASIEPAGSADMRCITVSHPSSLYVTNDFIVTHNSSVALSFALHAARQNRGVALASLEMTASSLAMRAISEGSDRAGRGVAYADARRGQISETEDETIFRVAHAMSKLPIKIIPPSTRDLGGLLSAARRCAKQFEAAGTPMAALVIDYLQLIRSDARSRYEQITDISIALKQMALQLGVPVIALSQLSRAVEQREDKRPIMSDLRESGQLEQDADAILFCYRAEYYLRQERPEEGDHETMCAWHDAVSRCSGWIDIIVAKNRMGETGSVRVRYDEKFNSLRGGAA